jgi:hypothetical protein
MSDVGLSVQANSQLVCGLKVQTARDGEGPKAAVAFVSRRWDDGAYFFSFETGAVDPHIEAVLKEYWQAENQRRNPGHQSAFRWLGLTTLENRKVEDATPYDAAFKLEAVRYLSDWNRSQQDIEPTDIERSLRSILRSGLRGGGASALNTGLATPDLLCRRIVVARDTYGWEFPSNDELLGELGIPADAPDLQAFMAWWSKKQHDIR